MKKLVLALLLIYPWCALHADDSSCISLRNDFSTTKTIFYTYKQKLRWNHDLSSAQVAKEWIRQIFSTDKDFVDVVKNNVEVKISNTKLHGAIKLS